jgi:CheY-like chemotaxis protein
MLNGPHPGQLSDPDESAEEAPLTGLRILIVEEDEVTRQHWDGVLRKHGHHVEFVWDRPEGLRSILVTTPDVVLLSGEMCSNDRQQIVERLAEQAVHKRPFFIVLADHARPVDQLAADEAPIDLYLDRPLNAHLLQRVLNRLQDILMPEPRVSIRDLGEVEFLPMGVR